MFRERSSSPLLLIAIVISTLVTSCGSKPPPQPSATVTIFAGSISAGSLDGTGTNASFENPGGLAIDAAGNIYVADITNNKIRKINSGGVVSTLAGSGSAGSSNGTGSSASFRQPYGVAVDGSGNVYVADSGNNMIRKIAPGGVVTTLAGSTTSGNSNGTGTGASFFAPYDVAVQGSGNIYVADGLNNLIRQITPAAVVTTLAGSGSVGSSDGTGASASFSQPFGVTIDGSGNVYIADTFNNLIRKITSGGIVSTLAGSTISGSVDGTGANASFNVPVGIAVDGSGNVYVADSGNNMIRKITPSGVVTTLAGSTTAGSSNGSGASASFNGPQGIVVDSIGNIYVADAGNNMIRKLVQ